jgi:hypothetical protein
MIAKLTTGALTDVLAAFPEGTVFELPDTTVVAGEGDQTDFLQQSTAEQQMGGAGVPGRAFLLRWLGYFHRPTPVEVHGPGLVAVFPNGVKRQVKLPING